MSRRYIRVAGLWVDDAKAGRLLHLSKGVELESLPDSIIEEDQFFKSKAIKGIGPKTLRALRGIADEDGGTIADIFDTCSWKLRTVHGIGPNVSPQ